ncbi:MAG: glycosyltransferase [Thermoleophilia bacterium]
MSPRVVDVTQWYSPTSGGIRTYLHAKAAWAVRNGRDHAAVVTGELAGREPFPQGCGRTVRGRTPSSRWGYRVAVRPGAILTELDLLEPDVIVLHDPVSFPVTVARWARSRGVPVAMFCHSSLPAAVSGVARPARRPLAGLLEQLERRGVRAADHVLVATPGMADLLPAHLSVPVTVSPLGIDSALFTAAMPDPAVRTALLGETGRHLLLYAGRLSSEKRVELLPRTLALLGPGHVLAVAGTGAARSRLMREARRLEVDDRIVLLGHLADRTALATLMASADCFVHPTPWEPFGLAPLEALAAGCRVVAADSPGPRLTVGGRGGVLVAPGDASALADGVRAALASAPPMWDTDEADWRHVFAREWALYRELAA